MNTLGACNYYDWSAKMYGPTEEHLSTFAYILMGFHLRFTKENRKSNILDVGCGTGLMLKIAHKMGFKNIHGIDGSQGMLNCAVESTNGFIPINNFHYHNFCSGKWDGEGNKFSHIISHSVIPFIPDLNMLFENFLDLLGKDGLVSFNFLERDGWDGNLLEDEYGKYSADEYYEKNYKFYLRKESEVVSKLTRNFIILESCKFTYSKGGEIQNNIIVAQKK